MPNNNIVSLQFNEVAFKALEVKAKEKGLSVSTYIERLALQSLDATEYLLSSEASRVALEKSIANAEAGNVVVKSIEEIEAGL